MEWRVEITETLQRTVCIAADSREEAMKRATEMYRHGDVVLSCSDFVGTAFDVRKEDGPDAVL